MTTVFNKIHRLKRQPGWTWDRFLTEIQKLFPAGLDEKTLYSHYRLPHKKATNHVTRVINQLHDECFPDPFPEAINSLMRVYNNLIRCNKHLSKEKDIADLECYLIDQLERENEQDNLRWARLNWLLGNIHFNRLPTFRDNSQWQRLDEAQHKAIFYYQQSVYAIEAHNRGNVQHPVGAHHLYKARHNILACYLNAVPQEQRSNDATILRYLQESNYLPNSKQTLEAEPFQWGIARNGLRFSSLLQNEANVAYFFTALVELSEHFLDLDYAPLNAGPISAGTDFEWAIHNVLTPLHLDKLRHRCKTKKERK